jgi:hypothetical protein
MSRKSIFLQTDTFPLAARHRLPIFASPLINPPDKLKAGLVVYRQGLPAVSFFFAVRGCR